MLSLLSLLSFLSLLEFEFTVIEVDEFSKVIFNSVEFPKVSRIVPIKPKTCKLPISSSLILYSKFKTLSLTSVPVAYFVFPSPNFISKERGEVEFSISMFSLKITLVSMVSPVT